MVAMATQDVNAQPSNRQTASQSLSQPEGEPRSTGFVPSATLAVASA